MASPVAVVDTTSSLHPNQPGVLHVVEVGEGTVVVIFSVVVVSSLQPNQPGVRHVEVVVVIVVVMGSCS